MSDHTLGPWESKGGSVYGSDKCPRSLCLLNEGKEKWIQNGLLIAAAPDMLQALKAEEAWRESIGLSSAHCDTLRAKACDLRRAAIAKAEGGSDE